LVVDSLVMVWVAVATLVELVVAVTVCVPEAVSVATSVAVLVAVAGVVMVTVEVAAWVVVSVAGRGDTPPSVVATMPVSSTQPEAKMLAIPAKPTNLPMPDNVVAMVSSWRSGVARSVPCPLLCFRELGWLKTAEVGHSRRR
jgi:hypothetical protein